MVVFAGEAPINAKFYNQQVSQAPLVTRPGRVHRRAVSVPRMMDYVREAFHIAKDERRPVVLGIPYDLRRRAHGQPALRDLGDLQRKVGPACTPIPRSSPRPSSSWPRQSGRSSSVAAACWVRRTGAVIKLADRCGALLSNTLPARGSSTTTRSNSAPPAAISRHSAGKYMVRGCRARGRHEPVLLRRSALLGKGRRDPLDDAPRATRGIGRRPPTSTSNRCARRRRGDPCRPRQEAGRWQTDSSSHQRELAHRIATEPANSIRSTSRGSLDPRREVIKALDAVVPKDWDIVVGGGHQAYFNTQMRGRPAERYTTVREFGAVGNGLCYALGVAAARRRAARAKSCCSKATAGSCSISRSSRRSSVTDFAS